jgi:NifU-like protein involved in Fe-S cluster formation
MSQYSDKVMEHFRNPHNVGEMENPDGTGHVGNPICVTPDTLVLANSQVIPINSLAENKKVLSHDGKYHTIIKKYSRSYQGKAYQITTHNLGNMTITPEHNILALPLNKFDHKYRNYKKFVPDWQSAQELKKGDVLLYPIPKEIKNVEYMEIDINKPSYDFKSKLLPKKIKVTDEFLRLAGYYLAEGYVRTDKCKGTLGFVFGSREQNYVDEVEASIKKVFNITPAKLVKKNNSINIMFYSAMLARFFEKHFGKGAANKHLPHWMTLLPLDKQEHILCGLWRGDGYINERSSKFITISRDLAYQVRLILLREKIIFSFLTTNEKGMHKQHYSIYVNEQGSKLKLAEIVGVKLIVKVRGKYPKKSWYDDNYYYLPIRKISMFDYNGVVHNLEIEESHSYVTNAAILHNCGDIMELYIKVENEIIVDAKFKTMGCGAAIATSSMVTDMVKGKNIEEALEISNKAVAEALGGLPPVKMHCSVLAEQALKSAIDDYYKKTGKPSPVNPDDLKDEHSTE